MGKKFVIVVIFAAVGFLFSLIASLIASVSIRSLLLRALVSTLIMGGLGFIFVYLENKLSEETINQTEEVNRDELDYKDIFKKNSNKYTDISKEYGRETFSGANQNSRKNSESIDAGDEESDIVEAEVINENKDTEENLEESIENETILDVENLESGNIDEKIIESTINNEEQVTGENKIKIGNENIDAGKEVKDDVLSELEKEVKVRKKGVNIGREMPVKTVIVKDSDIDINKVEEEKSKISTFSTEAVSGGSIEKVDDKYIHLGNNKKIENNPEKIAKVINRLLHEDNEK